MIKRREYSVLTLILWFIKSIRFELRPKPAKSQWKSQQLLDGIAEANLNWRGGGYFYKWFQQWNNTPLETVIINRVVIALWITRRAVDVLVFRWTAVVLSLSGVMWSETRNRPSSLRCFHLNQRPHLSCFLSSRSTNRDGESHQLSEISTALKITRAIDEALDVCLRGREDGVARIAGATRRVDADTLCIICQEETPKKVLESPQ